MVPQTLSQYTSILGATPTVPKFYWDVKSQEQRIKIMCYLIQGLIENFETADSRISKNASDIAELRKLFKDFVEHGFDDYYAAQIEQWFIDNAWRIYDRIAKQVFFGLTDDGHFCAYVPDSWKDVQFDTGAVFGRSDYGRLCLKFQPDDNAHGTIDNTYSYSLNDWNVTDGMLEKIDSLIADLEVNSKRTDSTFDTLFTNLDSPIAAAQGRRQTDKSLTKDGENI